MNKPIVAGKQGPISTFPNTARRWRDDCRGLTIEVDGVAHAVEQWEYDRRILVKEPQDEANPCGEFQHALGLIDQAMSVCGLFFYVVSTDREQPTRVVTCLDCLAVGDNDDFKCFEEPGIGFVNPRAVSKIQFSINEDDETK